MPPQKGYLSLLWEQFDDYTIKVMLIAGLLTLVIGVYKAFLVPTSEQEETEFYSAISIIFAVALITTFTAATQKMQNRQFIKLFD